MRTYTTRRDAIRREIVEVINNSPYDTTDDHAIELIADDVLGDADQCYARVVDEEVFWVSVIDHVSTSSDGPFIGDWA